MHAHLIDGDPDAAPVRVAIDSEGERLVASVAGTASVAPDDGGPVDAIFSGDRGEVLRVIAGIRSPGEPGAARTSGDPRAVARLAPRRQSVS